LLTIPTLCDVLPWTDRQLVNSRRETSHDPTASTHACCTATQRQERADPTVLCPGSPPARAVLPHLPRPPLCTGAAALLPAPQKHRWPGPRVHAPLLQWPPLLLSARLAA